MRFADIRTEWRVEAIEQQLSQLSRKAEAHEVSSLSSNVDRLEHSLREACTCIDGLRSMCESLLSRIEQLETALERIQGGK